MTSPRLPSEVSASGQEVLPSLRAVFWVLLALWALLAACTIWVPGIERAVAFSAIDDALYYPQIAHRVATRGMLSYDGVTWTNGFHPLWMMLLIPLYAICPDPMAALSWTYALVSGTVLAGAWLLGRIGRRSRFSSSGLAVLFFIVLLNLRSFTILFSLLESHLVLLTQLAYLAWACRVGARRMERVREAFLSGLLLGLCFLARLDAFLLAFAYGFVLVWQALRGRLTRGVFLRAAGASAAGFLLLAGPYLAFNRAGWGHWGTVSSYQKFVAPSVGSLRTVYGLLMHQWAPRVRFVLQAEWLSDGMVLAVFAAAALALAGVVGWRLRQAPERETLRPFSEYFLFAALHLVFIAGVAPVDTVLSAWYVLPQIIAVGLVLGRVTPDWRLRGQSLAVWAVVAVTVLQLGVYPVLLKRKAMTFAKLEVAAFIRNRLPASARGAMLDSGITAYFSERDFVGLNGLIGDFHQADLVRQKQWSAIAAQYGVDFLVLDVPDRLLPVLEEWEVFRSATKTKYSDFREPPKAFVVYRVTPPVMAHILTERYRPHE